MIKTYIVLFVYLENMSLFVGKYMYIIVIAVIVGQIMIKILRRSFFFCVSGETSIDFCKATAEFYQFDSKSY